MPDRGIHLAAFFSGVLRSAVTKTAAVNVLITLSTLLTGVLVARGLGDEGRGNYAAILAWYTILLVVGELGQSAAVTYHVSRSRSETASIVATARAILLPLGLIVTVTALLAAPWLSDGSSDVADAYRIAFLTCMVNALLGPNLYALQAISIHVWNRLRLVQPLAYLTLLSASLATGTLTLKQTSAALLCSVSTQLLLAWVCKRRMGYKGDGPSKASARKLASFGARHASSAVPESVASGLDRVSLSQWASPSSLGQYSVALSTITAAAPLVSAVSSVAFPRLAAYRGGAIRRRKKEFQLFAFSTTVAVLAVSGLAVLSPWAIPAIFGPDFTPAVEVVWWLAPAAIGRSVSLILSSILRGRGALGLASAANLAALAGSASLVLLLVPDHGVLGAAIATGVGQVIGSAILLFFVFGRTSRDPLAV